MGGSCAFPEPLFLGDTLDVDHLEADYTDGVMTLPIPVAEHRELTGQVR